MHEGQERLLPQREDREATSLHRPVTVKAHVCLLVSRHFSFNFLYYLRPERMEVEPRRALRDETDSLLWKSCGIVPAVGGGECRISRDPLPVTLAARVLLQERLAVKNLPCK